MKKSYKVILIIIISLAVINELLGLIGIFKVYKNPTTANEPNLKLNSKMFVSNLPSIKNGDFVCYKYDDEIFGSHIRVHRLVAQEDDIIEIREGRLFVNNEKSDNKLNLIYTYNLSKDEFNDLKHVKEVGENSLGFYNYKNGSYNLGLDKKMADSLKILDKRVIEFRGKYDKVIDSIYGNNWNKDNFGPLRIPKGKVFLLGDNRDNSLDSRYSGLINKTDIVGVVIKIFN